MDTNDTNAIIRTYGNQALPEGTPDRPLVTFAVFAYNQEKYIREAVEGAFAQTYSPLEIILSDDCSSDRTFEIMEEMARAYRGPHRVVVRRNRVNFGTLGHVLAVARQAVGRFLVVAAGDDISLAERTETMIKVMLAAPDNIVVASSDDTIFDDEGKIYDSSDDVSRRRSYFKDNPAWFHGATACYRTPALSTLPFPEEKILFEDMALIATFAALGNLSLRIEKPLVNRRAHECNTGTLSEKKKLIYDPWEREFQRLSFISSTAKAIDYAARALDTLGGDGSMLHHRASFMRYYARWPDLTFTGRVRLFSLALRHGYGRSALIRLFGKSVFLWVKTRVLQT